MSTWRFIFHAPIQYSRRRSTAFYMPGGGGASCPWTNWRLLLVGANLKSSIEVVSKSGFAWPGYRGCCLLSPSNSPALRNRPAAWMVAITVAQQYIYHTAKQSDQVAASPARTPLPPLPPCLKGGFGSSDGPVGSGDGASTCPAQAPISAGSEL